ncbi:Wall-associated receptor kinase 1 [Hordeum vulgare]|uniref:Protein kinase domain-containing protein n=1 Tax=Hordeum vulgare subsp. vulgare TaxID=112509 RepID=A0A8I7BF60_HORVV|nr:wall-associated receptor kinase 1-like [Hordeum vulgare subsp. vulgare]KAE8781954.1 Wall-associated receptor kinase 1 [Hordeum vulgare]
MSTSSYSRQLPVILLVLLVVVIQSPSTSAAAAEKAQGEGEGGCLHKCGDMDIPFPFGIGAGPGCFREGFEVVCNHSSDPPRAFFGDKRAFQRDTYLTDSRIRSSDLSPLELVSTSVARGEARAYAAVSYRCSTNESLSVLQVMNLLGTPFSVSATRNVFISVGYQLAELRWVARMGLTTGFTCTTQDEQLSSMPHARNGSCTGWGCCERTIPPEENPVKNYILSFDRVSYKHNWLRVLYPCGYGMLVEKSGYNFSTTDIIGDKTLLKRFPRGVALVLDFAAGNTSCPAQGQPLPPDYACVSGNSSCANATDTYSPAYVCKCWDGYDGNPYIANGCQDIDECKQPQVYPCSSGICKNRLGGYDCPCKFGTKGDAKAGTCTDVFTPAAKATVGAIGGILLMVILSFLVILRKEKQKAKEFFKKNGGPTLEKANVIKLFKKEDLKPILKSSNLIGKGAFGEVYKGRLDNKEVAIKKPINGSVLENDQFANEVIIQSQVIHKNIVRLIGCCLEVDAPMLVYEFITKGSLHDNLHGNNNKVALNLDVRLSIAAQSADGLAYMHSKANIRILHGDVKPANILLDDNFVPKISDFGISRLIARDKQHTGSVIGDMNYMDPVYLQEGLLTEKSDVYSFGVVILELISSRIAIRSEHNSLVKSFLEAHKKQKKATEFFDKEIAIAEDLEFLDSLAVMAVECLRLDVDQRPTMMEVAERLHILSRSRKVQDVCQ